MCYRAKYRTSSDGRIIIQEGANILQLLKVHDQLRTRFKDVIQKHTFEQLLNNRNKSIFYHFLLGILPEFSVWGMRSSRTESQKLEGSK